MLRLHNILKVVVFLSASGWGCFPANAAEPAWRPVGAAKVDITPDYPIRLSGYGSRTNVNTGVAQRLYAKALAVGGDADGPGILVTVDNCGVPGSIRDEVIRRLGARTKVRPERFALASTHTHCGPMLLGVLPNLFAPITGPLDCQTKQIDLAYDTLPTRSEWQALAESKTAAVAYHARKNLARLDRGELLPSHLPYLVQTWSFGAELAMVFLAGEVVVDYSLLLKREFDPGRLWVNAYANDVPCYIPSRRILDEGGYEGAAAMVYYDRPARFASDVEDRILSAVRELVPDTFRAGPTPNPMAFAPPAIAYPDHSQLMVVRDARGTERPVKTPGDWAERVNHIRANMQQVMGPLPDASRWAPLDIFVVSEERTPKFLRRKVRFTSEPGDRVPAWILIPNDLPKNGKAPAMLCLHQTTDIGKDEPAGLGGLDSMHYALELAQRGYVCLVPDYPSFGEYPYDFRRQGGRYASGSMKAVWNNQRAIDLLETLPQVNKDRIGAIGHSLGGHNALFTAVFDERLKAVVSSCGFTPFRDYKGGRVEGWTSDRYMPRIRDVCENNALKIPFDFYEIIAALAPRGFFSNSPVRDDNFDVAGVRKAFAQAKSIYSLHGAEGRLKLVTPEAAHDFPEAERLAAYAWLDALLK